jgi:hypothetical protein
MNSNAPGKLHQASLAEGFRNVNDSPFAKLESIHISPSGLHTLDASLKTPDAVCVVGADYDRLACRAELAHQITSARRLWCTGICASM